MSDPAGSPSQFPIPDRRVYDSYIAGRQSAVLAVAVRTGLFDRLDTDGPMTLSAIRESFGWSERPARSVTTALCAMGLLEREGDLLRASDDAKAYLVRHRPGSLWALIDMEVEHFLSPENLLESLKADDASVYGGQDPWEAHEEDPEKARAFTEAMHSVSERAAAGLAEHVAFRDGERVLDVGGGSGALCLAIAGAHPGVSCTVFDLDPVCAIAAGYAERAGLSDRISTQTGNFFDPEFPTGFDTVLLSQILHDWSFETGEELLRKAYACLPESGRLLVHEKLVEDGDRPLANALVHLDMLVWTKGQQYRFEELREIAERVGFRDVNVIPTVGYWSVVEARR